LPSLMRLLSVVSKKPPKPNMDKILNIVQIAIAALLALGILLQQRGAGLSSAFGGEGGVYFKKRGAEKIIFIATIILAVLFVGIAIARMILVK